MENIDNVDMTLYYQVDYVLTELPRDAAYFHAQFRRVDGLAYKKDYVLVDSIRGKGQYVGTYLAYGSKSNGWWGEGEIKFFMDGDTDFPTICGTGTEDYFCGSYDFDTKKKNAAGVETSGYTEFCSPYSGLAQVIGGDGHYEVAQRFGLYRWHISDPIRFEKSLRVTIQDLGWRSGGRYQPLQDRRKLGRDSPHGGLDQGWPCWLGDADAAYSEYRSEWAVIWNTGLIRNCSAGEGQAAASGRRGLAGRWVARTFWPTRAGAGRQACADRRPIAFCPAG